MEKGFSPKYVLSVDMINDLFRIEVVKNKIIDLPLTAKVLSSLRESARLSSIHYSTMIEGNRLTLDEVEKVVKEDVRIPNRERDEDEVKGYYNAFSQLEKWLDKKAPLEEPMIKSLHGIVMNGDISKVKSTPYRDGQNVIRESRTGRIVYLPPEAKDVPLLMKELVEWVNSSVDISIPVIAAIMHYQFATIHPYYDGNGRTARLLTTYILHKGGYGLKGLYSLEEYYAKNLSDYYTAISIGPSHNYYMGRAESDITPWVKYFIKGMAVACEKILSHMNQAQARGEPDQSSALRDLDLKQRKALELFVQSKVISALQIGELFNLKSRSYTDLCQKWVAIGFLEVVNPSKKARSYKLADQYERLILEKKV